MTTSNAKKRHSIDMILLVPILLMLIISIIELISLGSGYLLRKQCVYIGCGLLLLLLSRNFDYRKFKPFSTLLFIVSVILLVLVFAPHIGFSSGGARRWLHLGPLTISPAPIAEFSLILYLASYLTNKRQHISKTNFFITIYSILLIPALIFLKQPNLASTLVYILTGSIILYFAGARLLHIGFTYFLFILPIIYAFISAPYRLRRVTSFLSPMKDPYGSGYQIIQSFVALGSGGFTGVGFGNGLQKYRYLPDIHNTYILANVGEEFGLIGILIVMVLYLLFLFRGFNISSRAKDEFGRFIAFGITTWIGMRTIINMATISGLLPVMGISLPFISYGGTDILIQLFAIGILLNISYQTECYPAYDRSIKEACGRTATHLIKK